MYHQAQHSIAPATCGNDMRSRMPACHQFGAGWCWATAVAELTEYYNKSGPAQCQGLEYEIVGWCPKFVSSCASGQHVECCPLSAHPSCGNVGQGLEQIVQIANHFTGRNFTLTSGPLSQSALDAKLAAGKPILMLVGDGFPHHVVTVAGCGNGSYYFHDPELKAGTYSEYSYSKLLKSRGTMYNDTYNWLDTIVESGDETSIVV